MKIDMTYRYSRNEVMDAMLQAHIARFGQPPPGYQWEGSERYDGFEVRAARVTDTDGKEGDQ